MLRRQALSAADWNALWLGSCSALLGGLRSESVSWRAKHLEIFHGMGCGHRSRALVCLESVAIGSIRVHEIGRPKFKDELARGNRGRHSLGIDPNPLLRCSLPNSFRDELPILGSPIRRRAIGRA
jgi:hypothetical protein